MKNPSEFYILRPKGVNSMGINKRIKIFPTLFVILFTIFSSCSFNKNKVIGENIWNKYDPIVKLPITYPSYYDAYDNGYVLNGRIKILEGDPDFVLNYAAKHGAQAVVLKYEEKSEIELKEYTFTSVSRGIPMGG